MEQSRDQRSNRRKTIARILDSSDVDDEEGFNSGAAPVTTFVRKTTNDDVAAKPSRETQLDKLDTACEQSVSVGFDTVHSSDLPKVQDRNGDQVNLEPAKKAMPHLEISIVDGILILKDRSPTDLLADFAIEYATKFGERHRLYLEILAHQLMMKEREGLATIATLMQPVLGDEPGSVLLLLITALLAFRSSDLSLVARELLGRFHEVKAFQLELVPVNPEYREKAKSLYIHLHDPSTLEECEKMVRPTSTTFDDLVLEFVPHDLRHEHSGLTRVLQRVDLASCWKVQTSTP